MFSDLLKQSGPLWALGRWSPWVQFAKADSSSAWCQCTHLGTFPPRPPCRRTGSESTGPRLMSSGPDGDVGQGGPGLTRVLFLSMSCKTKSMPSHAPSKGDRAPLNVGCVCVRTIFLHHELLGS